MPRPSATNTPSVDDRRLRQRETQRGAHERRGARRRDRPPPARPSRTPIDIRIPARSIRRADDGTSEAELEHAREIERQHEEQHREADHHRRRLQLEAPAQLFSGRAQASSRPASATNVTTTPAANASPCSRSTRANT